MDLSVSPFEGVCNNTSECVNCPIAKQVITKIGEYIGQLSSMSDNEQKTNLQVHLDKTLDILSGSCLPYISSQIGDLYPALEEKITVITEEEPIVIERRSEERNTAQNILTALIRTATIEGHHVLDKGQEDDPTLVVHEISSVLSEQQKALRTRDISMNRRVKKTQFVEKDNKPGIIEI